MKLCDVLKESGLCRGSPTGHAGGFFSILIITTSFVILSFFSINNNHVFLKIMFRAKSVSRIYTLTCVRRRNDVQKQNGGRSPIENKQLHFSDKNPVFNIVTTENT